MPKNYEKSLISGIKISRFIESETPKMKISRLKKMLETRDSPKLRNLRCRNPETEKPKSWR